MKTKHFLLVLSLLTTSFLSKAEHILGGYMTYSYQGNNSFEIEMRFFRDCASSGAFFDTPAVVSVFRLETTNYFLEDSYELNPDGPINMLSAEQDDCMIEPFPFLYRRGDIQIECNLTEYLGYLSHCLSKML